MKKYAVQIIIPTYHASATIRLLVRQLQAALSDCSLGILLVDDGSIDDTKAEIISLAEEYDNVRYHFSLKNQGQQASLHLGLKLISTPCDYVVTMDDDMQNPAEVVPLLLETIQQGYDLVYGIPEGKNQDKRSLRWLLRQAGSTFRDLLFACFSNKPKGIRVSAFRIMTYELALKVAASTKKYFYLSAEAFQYKIRVANVFYPYQERLAGHSSYTLKKLLLLYFRLLFTYKIKLLH